MCELGRNRTIVSGDNRVTDDCETPVIFVNEGEPDNLYCHCPSPVTLTTAIPIAEESSSLSVITEAMLVELMFAPLLVDTGVSSLISGSNNVLMQFTDGRSLTVIRLMLIETFDN